MDGETDVALVLGEFKEHAFQRSGDCAHLFFPITAGIVTADTESLIPDRANYGVLYLLLRQMQTAAIARSPRHLEELGICPANQLFARHPFPPRGKSARPGRRRRRGR